MAAAEPGKVQPGLLNKCVNCIAYGWGQPEEVTTLRKCKQCKMLQYCSESCQKEHWKLVHKKHCQKIATIIASYHEIGDDLAVSEVIFSHHPFSASEVACNPVEALVMLAQKILTKMQFRNRAAYTKVTSQLAQLETEMTKWMAKRWADKKIFPEKFHFVADLNRIFNRCHQTARPVDKESASQDLYSTLHLVLGRLDACDAVEMVKSMKDPRGVVPAKLWVGFQQDVGLLPSRLAELIKALSGNQFPSFQELLKIFCGDTLSQACFFCNTRIDVAAMTLEVTGYYAGIPTVDILPYLPPLFNCGANSCMAEYVSKQEAFGQLYLGLGATVARLQSTCCDYCFMLVEKVHRYDTEATCSASLPKSRFRD